MLKWQNWLYGLFGGFIGGGASAITTATGLFAAKSVGIDVPVLNFKAAGIVFLSSGITAAAAYLVRSPLPKMSGDTQFITKDQTKQ